MEFEEMKKIWDAQNNQPLYVLDEKALHNRIRSKMKGGLLRANLSEWSLMVVYAVTAGILIAVNPDKPGANIFMYIEAAWMIAVVSFVVVSRVRRIKAARRFDRSIHGDLDQAIALANYHIRLSRIINLNLFPMGAIMIGTGWEAGKLLKVSVVIVVAYALAFYVGAKGYRVNKRRRFDLQILKRKLETGN
jgi:hypothetical protein